VIGETPSHRPVFAPEWSDLAATLGTRPRACRAHRAQTKGKVERAIREVKEDFLWRISAGRLKRSCRVLAHGGRPVRDRHHSPHDAPAARRCPRWLTGQGLPASPSIADYDRLARRWALEVVAKRRHRTTGRVIGEAWEQERGLLREIPDRVVSSPASGPMPPPG
jgi:transposase